MQSIGEMIIRKRELEPELQYYFDNNGPVFRGKYFCAYCGKLFDKEQLYIDYIYPQIAMDTDAKVRDDALAHNIRKFDDINNMICSCYACRKTRDGDLKWVWRANFGKEKKNWMKIYLAIAIVILIISVAYLLPSVVYPMIVSLANFLSMPVSFVIGFLAVMFAMSFVTRPIVEFIEDIFGGDVWFSLLKLCGIVIFIILMCFL